MCDFRLEVLAQDHSRRERRCQRRVTVANEATIPQRERRRDEETLPTIPNFMCRDGIVPTVGQAHFPRRITEVIARRLTEEPVLVLTGPRTVGKSTLLRLRRKSSTSG